MTFTTSAFGRVAFDPSLNRKLAAASSLSTFIDPIKQLCDQNGCPYRQDGQFLMADFGHFSLYGSKLAVGKYFPFFEGRQ
jgi:hypothetical protein